MRAWEALFDDKKQMLTVDNLTLFSVRLRSHLASGCLDAHFVDTRREN